MLLIFQWAVLDQLCWRSPHLWLFDEQKEGIFRLVADTINVLDWQDLDIFLQDIREAMDGTEVLAVQVDHFSDGMLMSHICEKFSDGELARYLLKNLDLETFCAEAEEQDARRKAAKKLMKLRGEEFYHDSGPDYSDHFRFWES